MNSYTTANMNQRYPKYDVHASKEFDAGTYLGSDGSLVQVAGGCHWYTQTPHACTSVGHQQQQWSQQPCAQLQLEQEQQQKQKHTFVNSWHTEPQQQGQGQQHRPGQKPAQQPAFNSMQPGNQHTQQQQQEQQQQQQQVGLVLLSDGQTWQEVVWTPEIEAMHQSWQEHMRQWEAAGYPCGYTDGPQPMSEQQQAELLSTAETEYVPPAETEYVPLAETEYVPTAAETRYVPAAGTEYVPPADTDSVPSAETGYVPAAETGYVPTADTEYVLPSDELPSAETDYYPLTELIEDKALRGRVEKLNKVKKQQQRTDDKVGELQDTVKSQQDAMDKLKLQVENATAFVAMIGQGLGKIIDMVALQAAAACSTEAIAEVIFRASRAPDTKVPMGDDIDATSTDSTTVFETAPAPATPTTPTQAPTAAAAADTTIVTAPKATVLLRPSALARRPSPAAVLSTAVTAAPLASSCGLKFPRSPPKRCPLPSLVTPSAAPADDSSDADSTQQQGSSSTSEDESSPPQSPRTPDQDAVAVSGAWGPSGEVSVDAFAASTDSSGNRDMPVIVAVNNTSSSSEGPSSGASPVVVPVAQGGQCGGKGSSECGGQCADSAVGMGGCSGSVKRSFKAALMEGSAGSTGMSHAGSSGSGSRAAAKGGDSSQARSRRRHMGYRNAR